VDWHTPFAIVILEHKRIVHADPGTSFRSHNVQTPGHQPKAASSGSGGSGGFSGLKSFKKLAPFLFAKQLVFRTFWKFRLYPSTP